MTNDSRLVEAHFKNSADVWPLEPAGDTDEGGGRDDQYITVAYDVADGTYSLTYHPMAKSITTPCFTQNHAVIALRDAGYSFPQIGAILNDAYLAGKKTG